MEEISSPVIGNKCKLLAFRKVKSILIFFNKIYNIWK